MRYCTNSTVNWKKLLVFCLPFLIIITFLFWKCRYGFGNIDEGFYLSTAYRLVQGDALIKSEWNTTQLCYVLLYPFVSLFTRIAGSTDGIILAFRYIYTALHSLVSLFLFFRLKKYHFFGALFASLCLLVFAPFGIMALSYNSMGIDTLAVCLTLLVTSEKHLPLQWIISGIFLAFSVLCCPILILLFVFWCAATLICCILPAFSLNKDVFLPKKLLFLTIGAFIVAIVFSVFLFSRCTLADIVANVPNILGDPNHKIGFYKIVRSYFINVFWSNFTCSKISLISYGILLLAVLFDKNRLSHRLIYFVLTSIITVFFTVSFLICNPYINFICFPLSIMGLFIALLSKNPHIRKLFWGFWLPAMLASYCYNIGSDQEFYVISAISILGTFASIIMISVFVKESNMDSSISSAKKKTIFFVFILLSLFQLCSELYMRYNSIYWENSMQEQKYKIEYGCEKNLLVQKDKYDIYPKIYKDLSEINNNESIKSVFFTKGSSLFYLDCWKKRNASYSSSAWSLSEDFEYNLSKNYYKNNPDKMPDLVYYIDWPLYLMPWNEEDFNRYHSDIFPRYIRKQAKNGIQLLSPACCQDIS